MSGAVNTYRPIIILAPGVLAGAEKVVLTGITALYELGLNPLMIIIRETRIPQLANDFQKALNPNIENIIIDSKSAMDLKLPKKLKKILKNQELPIVLHTHGFKALVAGFLAKGKSIHIHTHHGNTSHTFKV
ncbi:MAG: hypothetical protein Q7U04_06580, partial [Bacteriovorax sp.]|nr:hypothetical protein [Bacteriovorax sp.]